MNKKVDAVISPNFVEEMMRLAFANRDFARMVTENLDLSNFPREMSGCKAMLKVLMDNMKKGNFATYGMVEMAYATKEEVIKKIKEVQGLPLPDFEPMVEQLETFLKRQTFVATQHEISDMYNEGKQEEAMQLLEKRMTEINGFSLLKQNTAFRRIYRDFDKNISTISNKAEDNTRSQKMPVGITTIDDITDGGVPRQDTLLMIMRSGVGKSTFLKYMAWYNTAIAHNHVLHVQLEGGADEAVVKFDQMIAHTTYSKIMRGEVSDEIRLKVKTLINRAKIVNSDIDVYATEELLDLTIGGLVEVIETYKKEYGFYPDLLTLDSIDLLLTGENRKIDYDPNFIKYRLQKCAQRLKDIAKKYDMVVATATQTGDVPFEIWNDPSRVVTRANTEGDRTLVKPFSFVFTGNQTLEEGKNNMMRIFFDKMRNYKNNGIIVRIPTNYENGYFYDMSRSVNVECILDMSAMEKLERRGKNKEGAVPQERVEIQPGVYSSKPGTGAPVSKRDSNDVVDERTMKDSFRKWSSSKRAPKKKEE